MTRNIKLADCIGVERDYHNQGTGYARRARVSGLEGVLIVDEAASMRGRGRSDMSAMIAERWIELRRAARPAGPDRGDDRP